MLDLDQPNRNRYMRLILTILRDKYHVKLASLARQASVNDNMLYDFLPGRRTISLSAIDRLDEVIMDLYGPIIEDELEINQPFIQALIDDSNKNKSKR